MFEQIGAPEILKWAALVFLAGFIGFFGKYLGRVVLALFQRKNEDAPPASGMPDQSLKQGSGQIKTRSGPDAVPENELSRQEQKLLKKALKNEAKARKKSEKQ